MLYYIIIRNDTNNWNNRFSIRAITNDGNHYDFGLKGSKTYLDHQNKYLRDNYHKRHLTNEKERCLIENNILSPALLSFYILWGGYTDINNGIKYVNNKLKLTK